MCGCVSVCVCVFYGIEKCVPGAISQLMPKAPFGHKQVNELPSAVSRQVAPLEQGFEEQPRTGVGSTQLV